MKFVRFYLPALKTVGALVAISVIGALAFSGLSRPAGAGVPVAGIGEIKFVVYASSSGGEIPFWCDSGFVEFAVEFDESVGLGYEAGVPEGVACDTAGINTIWPGSEPTFNIIPREGWVYAAGSDQTAIERCWGDKLVRFDVRYHDGPELNQTESESIFCPQGAQLLIGDPASGSLSSGFQSIGSPPVPTRFPSPGA